MRTKLLPLVSFLLLANAFCYGQRIIINGEETTRKLQWSDFTGKADESSPFFARTWWKINYKISKLLVNVDTAALNDSDVKFEVEATLELDPEKSWIKKDKEADWLLEHEQGHFICGILCMNEFLASCKKTVFKFNNYQTALRDLFNRILKKYSDLGRQYDEETNHGLISKVQSRWSSFLEEQLKAPTLKF